MVFIHPRYVDLLFRVNYLRDCISDLIVERDRLINFTCEEIKADYMLKIGSLKYKEILLKNKVKKISRKIELIEENKIHCDNGNYNHLSNIFTAITLYEVL